METNSNGISFMSNPVESLQSEVLSIGRGSVRCEGKLNKAASLTHSIPCYVSNLMPSEYGVISPKVKGGSQSSIDFREAPCPCRCNVNSTSDYLVSCAQCAVADINHAVSSKSCNLIFDNDNCSQTNNAVSHSEGFRSTQTQSNCALWENIVSSRNDALVPSIPTGSSKVNIEHPVDIALSPQNSAACSRILSSYHRVFGFPVHLAGVMAGGEIARMQNGIAEGRSVFLDVMKMCNWKTHHDGFAGQIVSQIHKENTLGTLQSRDVAGEAVLEIAKCNRREIFVKEAIDECQEVARDETLKKSTTKESDVVHDASLPTNSVRKVSTVDHCKERKELPSKNLSKMSPVILDESCESDVSKTYSMTSCKYSSFSETPQIPISHGTSDEIWSSSQTESTQDAEKEHNLIADISAVTESMSVSSLLGRSDSIISSCSSFTSDATVALVQADFQGGCLDPESDSMFSGCVEAVTEDGSDAEDVTVDSELSDFFSIREDDVACDDANTSDDEMAQGSRSVSREQAMLAMESLIPICNELPTAVDSQDLGKQAAMHTANSSSLKPRCEANNENSSWSSSDDDCSHSQDAIVKCDITEYQANMETKLQTATEESVQINALQRNMETKLKSSTKNPERANPQEIMETKFPIATEDPKRTKSFNEGDMETKRQTPTKDLKRTKPSKENMETKLPTQTKENPERTKPLQGSMEATLQTPTEDVKRAKPIPDDSKIDHHRASFFAYSSTESESDQSDVDDDDDWDSATSPALKSDDDEFSDLFVPGLYLPALTGSAAMTTPTSPARCHSDDLIGKIRCDVTGSDVGETFDDDIVFSDDVEDEGGTGKELGWAQSEKLVEVNTRWRRWYPSISSSSGGEDEGSVQSGKGKKRRGARRVRQCKAVTSNAASKGAGKSVRFAPTAAQRIPVLNESEWAEDYDRARVGPWKTFALDRMRFERRIKELDQELGWVFDARHRSNISSTRYSNSLMPSLDGVMLENTKQGYAPRGNHCVYATAHA